MSGLHPETLAKVQALSAWWSTNPYWEGLLLEPLKFTLDDTKFTLWEDLVEWSDE